MTDTPPGLDFLVRKSDWREHRFAEVPAPELAPGQVLFRVDRFALTSNNVSYALTGDALGCWRFFPAEEGWGRIPAMGFGDVVRSTHPEVSEGTRCFGFYPMSRYLVIEPGAVGATQIVGLTSPRNLAFVRSLGCYEQVLTYDEIPSLDADVPAVLVDIAGSDAIRRAVQEHFAAALRHSCSIGATHWQAERSDAPLPGPTPEFFFAPAQIQKRVADWGPAGFQRRLADAWSSFRAFAGRWLEVKRGYGRDAVLETYRDTLAGRTRPEHGRVLSLWDSPAASWRSTTPSRPRPRGRRWWRCP